MLVARDMEKDAAAKRRWAEANRDLINERKRDRRKTGNTTERAHKRERYAKARGGEVRDYTTSDTPRAIDPTLSAELKRKWYERF